MKRLRSALQLIHVAGAFCPDFPDSGNHFGDFLGHPAGLGYVCDKLRRFGHVHPPRRYVCFSRCSLLILAGSLLFAPSAHAQEFYREAPGVRVFSGSMLCRPLQPKHWRERGVDEQEAQRRHDETTRWLLDYLGERPYWHREFMDEYYFPRAKGKTEDEVGLALLATGNFRYVCPNWGLYPLDCPQPTDPLCPEDPLFGDQWHQERIESRAGWQIRKEGHDDIVVAFFDSGIHLPDYSDHSDLSSLNEYRQLGYNSVIPIAPNPEPPPGWENPNDPEEIDMRDWRWPGHGIPVTGAAAATGDNEEGVCGIGWSLRHRMVKIVESEPGSPPAYMSSVFYGMEIAADQGDRVLSLSWATSGYIPPTTCDQATQQTWQAWEDNTADLKAAHETLLIFFAAGNDPRMEYCESYSAVLMVGGTMLNGNDEEVVWYDNSTTGSATGDFISLMAPAKNVMTTVRYIWPSGYYTPATGTSFAAPQAAGLANLIWSLDPDFTAAHVEGFILDGCDELSDYDPDEHGAGRINVFNSLALASGNLWMRTPNPGIADMTNTVKAAGAANGATIRFFYGTSTGSTSVQGCSGLSVDIASAIPLGTATAGGNGAALKSISVPSGWSTQTVYLQAVEYSDPCRKSNVVIYTFP